MVTPRKKPALKLSILREHGKEGATKVNIHLVVAGNQVNCIFFVNVMR